MVESAERQVVRGETYALSDEARAWLLAYARAAIAAQLNVAGPAMPETTPAEVARPGGCFVTVHGQSGQLRGCIGTFESDKPLWQAVESMAVAAASRDPRFEPLTAQELPLCHIEISVLSPRWSAPPDDLVVGVHGVCVARNGQRGVLLPQVALQHGWGREAFLRAACQKAGLAPDAWREPDILVELFAAVIINEPSSL